MDDNEIYEPELYTLTDENGEESLFELLASIEDNGKVYYGLTPFIEEETEEQADCDVVILERVIEDGEEVLVSIDDDDEYDRIGQLIIDEINAAAEDFAE